MQIPKSTGILLLSALSLAGCWAGTDRAQYVAGDVGAATFHNDSLSQVFLGGCSAFGFQQREDGAWVDRGPGVICVWEGFAQAVPAGGSVSTAFHAPDDPGQWRLRYTVGRSCDAAQPLSEAHCSHVDHVDTRPFRVVGACDPIECGPQLGMPNWLCPDGESFGGPTGRCLRDPDGDRCGWEIASCPANSGEAGTR